LNPSFLWLLYMGYLKETAFRWRWTCQPYTPAALYPQEDSWYSILLEATSNLRL
jgi:hypothetical protein